MAKIRLKNLQELNRIPEQVRKIHKGDRYNNEGKYREKQ